MKKLSKYWLTIIIIAAITVILNLLAFSRAFCDRYALTVYRALNAVIGTLTGAVSFPVGEIFMYIGVLLVVFILIFGIVRLVRREDGGLATFYRGYLKVCLMVVMLFLLAYTTNWSVVIRGSILKVSANERIAYTDDELEQLRTDIVHRMNSIAAQIARDENGYVISDFSQDEIIALMRARADEFPKFEGHYSPAKEAICSWILDMMGIGGYNYVYTMEPTYNRYVDALYLPVTICHELSHHKGYYQENEGTFLSVVILTESDKLLFQYAGYRELYYYVNEACTARIAKLDDIVINDFAYAREQAEEQFIEEVDQTIVEAVNEPVTQVSEKGWEVQSNVLKENIYDGMLLMYLQYYYEK